MKQKAMLWDRDGVLNHVLPLRESDGEKNVSPQKLEDFKLVKNAKKVLNELKSRGFLNIVHTNQPDIARNKMAWEELQKMHDFLKEHLPIDAFYVCPHGLKDGSDICECRKPKPGMLFAAERDFNLDLSKSYVVGDSGRDIEAGIAAGTKNILIRTEYNKVWKPSELALNNGVEFGDVPRHSYFEVNSLNEVPSII